MIGKVVFFRDILRGVLSPKTVILNECFLASAVFLGFPLKIVNNLIEQNARAEMGHILVGCFLFSV